MEQEQQTVEEQNQDIAADSPEGLPLIEKWHEVVSAVKDATTKALTHSPRFDPKSPSKFQTYWRDVFDRLHDEVVSDPKIPTMLTDPPRA